MLPNTVSVTTTYKPQPLVSHAYYDKKALSIVIGKSHTIPLTPNQSYRITLHGACWVFSVHPSPFANKGGKAMLEEANIYMLLHLSYSGEDEEPFNGFISLKLEGSKALPADMMLQCVYNGDVNALSPLKVAGVYVDALVTKLLLKRASGVVITEDHINDTETYTPSSKLDLTLFPTSCQLGKYTIQTIALAPVGYDPIPVTRAVKLLQKGAKVTNAYILKSAENYPLVTQEKGNNPTSEVIKSWTDMMAGYKEFTCRDANSSFAIQGLVYDTGTELVMLNESQVCETDDAQEDKDDDE